MILAAFFGAGWKEAAGFGPPLAVDGTALHEGVGLILAVDRLLDRCRTTVNIFSESCGAVIIRRSEDEKGILQT